LSWTPTTGTGLPARPALTDALLGAPCQRLDRFAKTRAQRGRGARRVTPYAQRGRAPLGGCPHPLLLVPPTRRTAVPTQTPRATQVLLVFANKQDLPNAMTAAELTVLPPDTQARARPRPLSWKARCVKAMQNLHREGPSALRVARRRSSACSRCGGRGTSRAPAPRRARACTRGSTGSPPSSQRARARPAGRRPARQRRGPVRGARPCCADPALGPARGLISRRHGRPGPEAGATCRGSCARGGRQSDWLSREAQGSSRVVAACSWRRTAPRTAASGHTLHCITTRCPAEPVRRGALATLAFCAAAPRLWCADSLGRGGPVRTAGAPGAAPCTPAKSAPGGARFE